MMLKPDSFIEFKKADIEQSIPDRFRAQVKQYPEEIAVKYKKQQLTYEQLNQISNRIAAAIVEQCGQKEGAIAILFETGIMGIAAIMGALKAGKIWVPLDASLPASRINYMLEDSQTILIVTNHQNILLARKIAQNSCKLLNLDETLESYSDEDRDYGVSPDSIAYILYTSGSTGQPKGVVQNHRNILHAIRLHTNTLYLCSGDRISQLSTYSHLGGLTPILRALLNGGAVFPFNIKQEGVKDLAAWLIEEEITIYHSVPTVFRHFVNTLTDKKQFPHLRLIHLGGEAVISRDVELYKKHFYDSCILLNNLGSTEVATYGQYLINKQTSIGHNIVPLICKLEEKKVMLIDENGKEIDGLGEAGEIAIKSPYLALGYWGKPNLTAEKFKSEIEAGSRIYLTGDLGRLLPDGSLEYLGRIDNQVKIRGLRIELGEIEATLAQHPDIREAAVIAREDIPGDKRLVAYIVPWKRVPTKSELRKFLKEKLPDYMVPSALVTLESLPLTPNGKIDRRGLPAPDISQTRETTFVAPNSPTEELLAAIWSQVLGVEKIGILDNFFELGGHSLKATQVISRVQQTFSLELPLRHLFESPTVAELALVIETARQTAVPVPKITKRAADAKPALSFAQERLWFLNRLEVESATYNMASAWRLEGTLSIESLELALQEMIRRHETLRTTFISENGVPIQVIAKSAPTSLCVIDLQQLPEDRREAQVQTKLKLLAQKPFDLELGPLLRVTLLQLGCQSYVLMLTIHHIVSDGWSMGLFRQSLSALYKAFSSGQNCPLADLPIQYADYALWQRELFFGNILSTQLNYWKQQLADAPPLLELPYDRQRPPIETFRGGTESFKLSGELTQKLRILGQKSGCTLFMTLLAAFSSLLYRYSGQSDILIGTPIANRQRQEIEPLIGFLVNSLVLRTQFQESMSFADLLSRVRQTAIEAYAHQDVPFEQLVQELQPSRTLSHNPLFQVMFALQNAPMGLLEFPGVTCSKLEKHSAIAKFDLTLSIEETAQGLEGKWEYNSDLFDGATICRWIGHFQVLLESIVANPQQGVDELPLLTETKRHQLLVEWNDTATDYSKDCCIHQLFEKQVERAPDAVAVVFEDEQLTYRQLNGRANQLAHYLRSLGVGLEVLVGICVERSVEMVVGLLGIIKAGGAYMPLDPNYPSDRLTYMLEDSTVPMLLTQKRLVEKLPKTQAQVVCLDADWGAIASCSHENPTRKAKPENLAYVIYTSGSTGRPKGVMAIHQGLCNLALAQIQIFNVRQNSRILQFASFSFDASSSEIVMSICSGARLVMGTAESLRPGPELIELLQKQGITHVTFPPSALGTLKKQDLPTLQNIIVAGEACGQNLVEQWSVGRHFFNAYGPTESTVCASVAEFGKVKEKLPIGRPLANTQIYILDKHLQPVPIGVSGEIHIGGVGLARGYLNRPEKTSLQFIPNPFSNSPGERLYKTGDLARYLADGNIEYIGRIDHQVKVRGFRIELGEIEAVLIQHPQIRETKVIAREDNPGEKRLVAYMVPGDTVATKSELRSFLKQKLPDYMVPSAFVTLEYLPLTPNGKIDRRRLPAPDISAASDTTFIAPRNELEFQLTQIWEEVLGMQSIGVKDNFFDLGGHSLLAIRLVEQIQEKFPGQLSVTVLFQAPTVAELSQYLSHQEPLNNSAGIVALRSAGARPPLFFIAPGATTALQYHHLVSYLPTEQPCYCFQSFEVENPKSWLKTMEKIAAYYLEKMLKVNPKGPYILVGRCGVGVVVIYEMALQLQAQGKQVNLIMLDPSYEAFRNIKSPPQVEASSWQYYLYKIKYHWQRKQLLTRIKEKLFERGSKPKLDGDDVEKINQTNLSSAKKSELISLFKQQRRAFRQYSPQEVYQGQINLILTEYRKKFGLVRYDYWQQLATEGLQLQIVPGHHKTMLEEPNVQLVAEKIKLCLAKIDD